MRSCDATSLRHDVDRRREGGVAADEGGRAHDARATATVRVADVTKSTTHQSSEQHEVGRRETDQTGSGFDREKLERMRRGWLLC